ncbi:MAG: hypothetical protein AB1592_09290 [Pseudomonadota bacterium]
MDTDGAPPKAPAASPPLTLAALSLGVLLPLVDADVLMGWRWAGTVATPFLVLYFACCWRRIMLTAKALLVLCVALGLIVLTRPHGADTLLAALSRMTFFPAFVAALALLRAAADMSTTVERAGRLLVNQPPSRRYAALTAGGHIFGILLNIGGLALLLDMTKRANTLDAAFGETRVVDLREKRMTLAVLRGFSSIAFWSPLGLALNLLLACMPEVAWADVAPYGFAAALAFMTLGLVFDLVENPRPTRPRSVVHDPGGARAVAALVGHIAALSGLALAAEYLTHFSFQAILINLVPLYAVAWLIGSALKRGGAPVPHAMRTLRDKGIARWPTYANEIAIFAASGLLGVILADLAPRAALENAIVAMAAPAGTFAAGLSLCVVVAGLLGINPMISASILAATLSSISVPGLSQANILLALAGGWACIIGFGPLMSSLVMASAVIGRRPALVGMTWNGRFVIAAVVLWSCALLIVRI